MSRVTGLLPVGLVMVVWQLVGPERSVTFPGPSAWTVDLQSTYLNGSLLPTAGTTLLTCVASLDVATGVGAVVDMVMGT